jgi:hypothetical protein
MVDQTMAKPMGLIRNLKIHTHGIPYIVTFIIIKNIVLDAHYSMLLSRSWLRDAKVSHDWEINLITIQGNCIFITIVVTKRLYGTTKSHEVLLCYDFINGIINGE